MCKKQEVSHRDAFGRCNLASHRPVRAAILSHRPDIANRSKRAALGGRHLARPGQVQHGIQFTELPPGEDVGPTAYVCQKLFEEAAEA